MVAAGDWVGEALFRFERSYLEWTVAAESSRAGEDDEQE